MNSRQFRVSGLSMIVLVVVILLFLQWIAGMDMENTYTYEQFETAVEEDQVASAVIR